MSHHFSPRQCNTSNAEFAADLIRMNRAAGGCFAAVMQSRPDADRRHVAYLLEEIARAADAECPHGFSIRFRQLTRPSTLELCHSPAFVKCARVAVREFLR